MENMRDETGRPRVWRKFYYFQQYGTAALHHVSESVVNMVGGPVQYFDHMSTNVERWWHEDAADAPE